MLKNSVFSGNIYKNVGDFSDIESVSQDLPVFFNKQTNYGLITKSRTISKEEFMKKLSNYING